MIGNAPHRAWQRMLSGRRLDIVAPSALDVEIEDVALGLSRLARWNGQTRGEHAYSVAQHSILVAELAASANPALPVDAVLAALLHDAPEYVAGDLVTPLKRAVGNEYADIEERLARAVRQAFRLPPELPAAWARAIHRADRTAAFLEAVALAGFPEPEARAALGFRGAAPTVELQAWDGPTARKRFLTVASDLRTGGRACLGRWREGSTEGMVA